MAWFGWFPVRRRQRAAPGGRQRLPHRRRRAGAELTLDAEAFLLGHLAERSLTLTGDVPVWAWANLLAHGTEDELRTEAVPTSRPGDAAWQWRQARSYLAGEVLHSAQLYGSLAEAQEKLVAPIELWLASSPEVNHWGPSRWVMAVMKALACEQPTELKRACSHISSALPGAGSGKSRTEGRKWERKP